jgi:shikimate dehydrogenase
VRDAPSAETALYGVAGAPIRHSMSPALHNAAFEALGIDAVSVAFEAEEDAAAQVVGLVRSLGVRGLSITMPLKGAVGAHCDERSETVLAIGSSNCLVALPGGRVRAESTDGAGLVGAVGHAAGDVLDSSSCAVLGAGGAARAAIHALSLAGAREILVVARRPERAERAASVAPNARAAGADEALGATVIVQATPVGMAGTPEVHGLPLLDAGAMGAGQVAVDLVYHPRVTPWLARAEAAGAVAIEGLDVLVHQAAVALGLWLGLEAPLEVLHEAVRER